MRVLVVAYTVLAVAAGARAGVQLATRAGEAPVPYALSAVAALVYLVLAVSLRRRGRWLDVAAAAAAAELAGVLLVGTAERLGAVAWPDQTVWSAYGAGYGFAPLVLPVAALVLLRRRPGRRLPGSEREEPDERLHAGRDRLPQQPAPGPAGHRRP
jgi:hypothetical protein